MCIYKDEHAVVKNGQLKLWKVIRRDNQIGLWRNTGWRDVKDVTGLYQLGINVAKSFTIGYLGSITMSGRFHCFFTRKEAREYTNNRYDSCRKFSEVESKKTKIIRVYADSNDVMEIGQDEASYIRAISVSKMEIKSLKHQR